MLNAVNPGLLPTDTPTNNKNRLQWALDQGGPVYIPRGLYPLAPGAEARAPGQVIFGDGPAMTILDCRGNGDFLSDGQWWGMEVRDLQMCGKVGGQQVTGGRGIVFDGSAASQAAGWQMPRGRVRDVLMDGMWRGIHVGDQNNMIITGVTMGAMQDHGLVAESLNVNTRTDALTVRDFVYSPDAGAVAAGRGTGILVDGDVQTIRLDNVNIVAALRGLHVQNTANLSLGQHAAFIFATALMVDFPQLEGVRVTHVDRARFSQSYVHGSRTAANMWFGSGAREVVLEGSNSTSAWGDSVYFAGAELDLVACDLDDANQNPVWGQASGLVIASPCRVGVVGGSIVCPRAKYGIDRQVLGGAISVMTGTPISPGTRLVGWQGGKNF